MLRNFRSYLIHHRAERRGTVAVLTLCILVMGFAVVYPRMVAPDPPEPSEHLAAIDTEAERGQSTPAEREQPAYELFRFDPNTLSDSGFFALGFSEREVSVLRKYMAAGGHFREKNDFGRLYFVDEARLDSLKPYLLLPDKAPGPRLNKTDRKKPKEERVKWSDTADYDLYKHNPAVAELNTADTNELLKIRGVGSFYARQISDYRDELGGFFTIAQLMEIWKMSEENVDRIAEQVRIDTSEIKKIDVNRATAQALSRHPYIYFGLANKIVIYREENGPFEDIDHMQAAGLLNDELRIKLAAYLDFR